MDLVESLLHLYNLSDFPPDESQSPTASVYHGAGGIAYAVYRIGLRRRNDQLITLAEIWAEKAVQFSCDDDGFCQRAWGMIPDNIGQLSLFHSKIGLDCIRALISFAMGDVRASETCLASFINLSKQETTRMDLMFGKAGLLIGCAELLEALSQSQSVNTEQLSRRGDQLADELVRVLRSEPMTSACSYKVFGLAHGWGGCIFALLRWIRITRTYPDPVLTEKLNELAKYATTHGRGLVWPVECNLSYFRNGWCNGTAGYVMLYGLAYEVLGGSLFLDIATRAANSSWATHMRLGSLCCGLAGVAYGFASMYRLTGSAVWLDRAKIALGSAASERFVLRDSLYRGALGVAVLADDLRAPSQTSMPLFEPMRHYAVRCEPSVCTQVK